MGKLFGEQSAFNIPRKTWPTGQGRVFEDAMRSAGVDPEIGNAVARALQSISEQWTLDEEANYNAIEDFFGNVCSAPFITGRGSKILHTQDTEPDVVCGSGDLWLDTSKIHDQQEDLTHIAPFASGVTSGSAVELASGQVLYVWADGTSINQGRADTLTDFATSAGSVLLERALFDDLTRPDGSSGYPRAGVAWDGPRLLLHTSWLSSAGDGSAKRSLYESYNEGATWELVTDAIDTTATASLSATDAVKSLAGPPRRLSDGSIVMMGTRVVISGSTFYTGHPAVFRSTDDGATWAAAYSNTSATPQIYTFNPSRSFGGPDSEMYFGFYFAGTTDRTRVYRSTNFGASWTLVADHDLEAGTGRPTLLVEPGEPSASGWGLVTMDPEFTNDVHRYLASTPSAGFGTWEAVGDAVVWPSGARDVSLQQVGDFLLLFAGGYVGTSLIVGQGKAELNVWDEARAEWVPVASTRVATHSHTQYADSLHEHTLNDLEDVDTAGVDDGDTLVYDLASEAWGPQPSPRRGTDSIVDPSTTVVVTHGLPRAPEPGEIQIQVRSTGHASERVAVHTETATEFTVEVDVAPGATDLDFGWLWTPALP